MANTEALKILIILLIVVNFFAGGFALSQQAKEFDINKFFIISNVRNNLNNYVDGLEEGLGEGENLSFWESFSLKLSNLTNIVLIPFVLFDYIFAIVGILYTGFQFLPNIINILLIVPLSIIIGIDYITPMIRGN